MKANTKKIGMVDIEIVVAIGICVVLSWLVPYFQVMTACISVLLCMQDGVRLCWKMGLTRLIITAIGGVVGVGVVLLDEWLQNRWLFLLLVMLGVLLTMLGCKLAKVPDISARIGGVTFVLVSMTLTSTARLGYALLRLLSTMGGVVVVLAVAAVFSLFTKPKGPMATGEQMQ